jgi:hypothetical protein
MVQDGVFAPTNGQTFDEVLRKANERGLIGVQGRDADNDMIRDMLGQLLLKLKGENDEADEPVEEEAVIWWLVE